MFYWLYERMLLSQIQVLPGYIRFMLSGADLAADPEKCFEVPAGLVLGVKCPPGTGRLRPENRRRLRA